MHQEPGYTGNHGGGIELALEQTGQAQHGVGDDEVANDALPADGNAAFKQGLQHGVGKADDQAGTKAPTDAEDDDGQHGEIQGAAPGHFVQGQEAENFSQGDEDCALSQGTKLLVGLHRYYLQRKMSHCNLSGRQCDIKFFDASFPTTVRTVSGLTGQGLHPYLSR